MQEYIICAAMPEETTAVIEALEGTTGASHQKVETQLPLWKLSGEVNGTAVTYWVIQSGVGEVNASLSLGSTLAKFVPAPTAVISTGTCGAIAAQTDIGHIIVGENYYYSNVDATAFGYALGQLPGMPTHYGTPATKVQSIVEKIGDGFSVDTGDIATGDTFVNDDSLKEILTRFPDIIGVDMETTALAQTCFRYAVPFIMIRCVSDLCLNDQGQGFDAELVNASEGAAAAVAAYLTATA